MESAKDIFKEISELNLNSETVKKILFSDDKLSSAQTYYRTMLLQYLKLDNLYNAYVLYHGLERGENYSNKIKLRINGEEKDIEVMDLLTKRRNRLCRNA